MDDNDNMDLNKKKENEIEELKLYDDYESFQGITFENNINSVNHLLFGQGLKISDIPFIIKEEKTHKNILAVNRISINTDLVDKTIFYPKKCVNIVFFHDNCIFYLAHNNYLQIYKLESNNIVKYFIPHNKNKDQKQKKSNIHVDLPDIFKEIKNIKEQNSVLDNYEILVNILNNNLKLRQKQEKTKSSKKTETLDFNFSLNNLNYKIKIEMIELEIDGIGMIREKLNVKKGQINLEEGICYINEYVKLKKENNIKSEDYINNSFKCPILYKNFDDDIIPENNTILMEIKSGIDISGLEEQIIKRIDLINDCLFKQGEKPSFFIGLINLDSSKKENLKILKNDFKFKEKTLIISSIDYSYCGIDLSYEISNDYIIFKELKK